MSTPVYPVELFKPSEDQKQKYLDALRQGHSDELAVLMADMTPAQAKDALVAIGEDEVRKARLMAQLPLAVVRERVNDLMLAARDEEQPMPFKDAIEILSRRDPTWSTKAQVNVTMPTPILDVEAVRKQAVIEAVKSETKQIEQVEQGE